MHAALLAEVIADPRSVAPRRVYADALLEAGDPRGELIQLQCALEPLAPDDPARPALDARTADLLALHEPAWTRELRERCALHDNPSQLTYRRGFVEHARLRASRVRELLPMLAAHTPLRELDIDFADRFEDLGDVPGLPDLEGLRLHRVAKDLDLARAFASWPHRGRLRSLHLDSGIAAARAIAGTPGLAGLESLSLIHPRVEDIGELAATPHLASLRTLRLPGVALLPGSVEALARSETLQSLEVLDLGRATTQSEHASARHELPALARLRELRCYGNTFTPPLATALATGARSLEVLALAYVQLEELGARALLRGATALSNLRHLDLSGIGITDAGFARVIDGLEVPGLRRLACGDNRLDAAAAAALSASRSLDELQQLFLHHCPLGDAGALALVTSDRLPALRVLDLSSTGCGRHALAALGAGDLGARLVALDISNNAIDDRGLGALLAGRRLDALERLTATGTTTLSPAAIRTLAASPLAARLRSLWLSKLGPDAIAQLALAELPELRTLIVGGFDDRAASILGGTRNAPWLQHVVLHAPALTDAGAIALANAIGLDRITWLELDAPGITEAGRDALRSRFGHRVGIFAGASLYAFSSLSRRF